MGTGFAGETAMQSAFRGSDLRHGRVLTCRCAYLQGGAARGRLRSQAKARGIPFVPFDADSAAVIAEVTKDLSRELQSRDQRLSLKLPSGPVWIRGDAIRLARVVWNLLDNASKCSGMGQRITIDLQRESDWVVLRVPDEGIGILPEELAQIFLPFVRGRDPSLSQRPGVGLGLTIMRQLVMLHGGSITAHSNGRGLGSQFTVRLPAISGES